MLDTGKYSDWFDNKNEWGLFDEDGFVIGIKPDAPQNVADSYEAMQQECNSLSLDTGQWA